MLKNKRLISKYRRPDHRSKYFVEQQLFYLFEAPRFRTIHFASRNRIKIKIFYTVLCSLAKSQVIHKAAFIYFSY